MRAIHTLLFSAVLSAGSICAQSLGEIRGRVFDPEGQPVPAANVTTVVNETLFGTTTDLDGRFVLKPLPPGRYGLKVTFVGYSDIELNAVEVLADRATYLRDLRMAIPTMKVFEKIDYVRDLITIDDPSRMSLLAEDIAKLPTVKDPIKFMGSQFAGVTPAPNGDGLYFRGSRTENMVSFIDGVKVSGSVPRVPPSAISSVQVYTGGLPARYGDVTGGVIVIETKTYQEMLQHARRKAVEQAKAGMDAIN
ncbi:MAG: carboxypeptidase regulatory-like domain-containing protein [Flavobacteriales bacterium]|nr:carboxypeptidase regulatory-like domain-containing protein [Flavobacteriales bacterium]